MTSLQPPLSQAAADGYATVGADDEATEAPASDRSTIRGCLAFSSQLQVAKYIYMRSGKSAEEAEAPRSSSDTDYEL